MLLYDDRSLILHLQTLMHSCGSYTERKKALISLKYAMKPLNKFLMYQLSPQSYNGHNTLTNAHGVMIVVQEDVI